MEGLQSLSLSFSLIFVNQTQISFFFSKRSNSDYKTTLETSTYHHRWKKIITKIELKPHKFIQDSIERCPGDSETPPRKHRLVKYGFARG